MTQPNYYIVYNPLTFNLMDQMGRPNLTPLDILSFLTDRNAKKIDNGNWMDFITFNIAKQRPGLVETLAIESYAASYIALQIARLRNSAKIVLTDGKRNPFERILRSKRGLPKAVFITAMSSNFPTAVAIAIALNHAHVPVVLGGIHVSTSPEDVDLFIRAHVPHPQLVAIVKGAGDSSVLNKVLADVDNNDLKSVYCGNKMIENRVWSFNRNVEFMEPLRIRIFNYLPLINKLFVNDFRVNPTTPYVGCPYSCKFCSISTLPKDQRSFVVRDTQDFIDELKSMQKGRPNLKNRYFFFLPDNLLLGAKKLDRLLDSIIASDLCINFAAQISIEIANSDKLLAKLRRAGATHFFIGLESLDIRNLKYINKNIVKDIERKGISVKAYYGRQIKKIQKAGISVHGSFIFGLPFDYFKTPTDNTGVEVADFCIENRIGIQPSSLTDLPGSVLFNESQENGEYLYGKKGTMDYLLSLCVADLGETNRIPPVSLYKSPLVVACLAYEAVRRVGHPVVAAGNALYIFGKSFQQPTQNGRRSFKQRLMDAFCSAVSQMAVSLYKIQGEWISYSNAHVKGIFERLYRLEADPKIKYIFKEYVRRFYMHP